MRPILTGWALDAPHDLSPLNVVIPLEGGGRLLLPLPGGAGPLARLIVRAPEMRDRLREVARLRLATNEGSLRVRADLMWRQAADLLDALEGNDGGRP